MNPLLAAALDYAARGWPVLPLRPRGKEPLTPHGVKDATTDAAAIEAWWRRWPTANVGVACGQGLLVVDLDPRAGSEFSWPEVVGEREVPPGPEVQTGGGGRHLYFAGSGRGGQLAAGVELKGLGGYVVAPPSAHPSGGRYTWVIGRAPGEVELPPLPGWLYPQRAPAERAALEKIPQGQRNNTLTSAAGALRRVGFDGPRIFAALKGLNAAFCDPPLPEAEVRDIAYGMERYAPAQPSRLRAFTAEELASAPDVHLDFLPFLGVDGYIPRGWVTLLAGYPKTGKTELAARLVLSWTGERVVYFSEESERIWALRLKKLGGAKHVHIIPAIIYSPEDLLREMELSDGTVFVIDTIRNLTGIQDENDNSEIARALKPFIQTANEKQATLLLLHHIRKGGGEHGEAIAGGHGFLGLVDVALEIARDPNLPANRRKVRGWARLFDPMEGVYELSDGSMRFLGSATAVRLDELGRRVLQVLTPEWASLKELLATLDDPKPSSEQLRRALNTLLAEGKVERDPKTDRRGAVHRWRLAQGELAEVAAESHLWQGWITSERRVP